MKTAIGSAFKQIKENISEDIRNGREMSAGNVAERKERVEHTETADEHIPAPARQESRKTSSAGIVIAVVIGIIAAVFILSQVLQIQITGTIAPVG